jgi:hypothetical protein
MGSAENSVPEIRGKQEMHDLAVATFEALEHADLRDVMDQLHTRIFAHGHEAVFETEFAGSVWQWSFKPMVELVLRHITDVARNEILTPNERRGDILAALELAGF